MSCSITARSSNAPSCTSSGGRAVMRLGIGELKLRKNGQQLLAEMHFQTKVILLRTPSTLVPSATKKTAVSVSLSPQPRR